MRRTFFTATIALALMVAALAGTVAAEEQTEADLDVLEPPLSAGSSADPTMGLPTDQPAEPTTDPTTEGALLFADPAWRRITPDKGPASREDHTWTVDGQGRHAHLFGGRDGEREFGDLWRYDLPRDQWKRLSAKDPRPSPRFGHSAVWVEGHGVAVFAGQRGTGFHNDLWAFDQRKGKWRKLPSGGAVPRPRYGSCLVVGPDGRLWMSHGFTTAGRFHDTRAHNLTSGRWTTVTPAGHKPGEDDRPLGALWRVDRTTLSFERVMVDGSHPAARYAGTLITDAKGGRLLLFGGQGDRTRADVWELVDRAVPTDEPSAEPTATEVGSDEGPAPTNEARPPAA